MAEKFLFRFARQTTGQIQNNKVTACEFYFAIGCGELNRRDILIYAWLTHFRTAENYYFAVMKLFVTLSLKNLKENSVMNKTTLRRWRQSLLPLGVILQEKVVTLGFLNTFFHFFFILYSSRPTICIQIPADSQNWKQFHCHWLAY